jgi:hypothetical protein
MRSNMKESDDQSALQELDSYPMELLIQAVLAKFGHIGTFDSQLKSRLTVLNSLISMNDRILDTSSLSKACSYPRKVTVCAVNASLSAPEFHAIEYSSYGPPARWTGPSKNFSFDIFVDRSSTLEFVLDFESVNFSNPMAEMKCFLDGREIELHVKTGGGGYLASGILPAREGKGASVITFACPDVKSPREDGHPDDRPLGVRFRRLSVEEPAPRAGNEALLRIVETVEASLQERAIAE